MGYLLRHWRGELPLAVSFWLNFVLVNVVLSLVVMLNTAQAFTDYPVYLCRISMSVIGLQLLVVFPWQFVGLWRAGTRRVQRGGGHALSVTLKVFLVLVLLFHVGETIFHWGIYRETFKIAFFKDDIPSCAMSLKADGRVLHLDGGLGFGVAEQFAEVLGQHPDIETVIVDSTGGRLYEARKMAKQILGRGLNTTTVSGCYSAGNLIFAAGEHRTLCKGAKLGFHEYYYPEPFEDYVDIGAEYAMDWGFYQLRGVTKTFQEKLFSAEPNDFWLPSDEELLEGGMIHAVVKLSDILPMQEAILLGYDTSGKPSRDSGQTVTAEQVKGWILGCSGLLWERNRDDFETLAGTEINPIRVRDKKNSLSEWWGIQNREELLNDLLWLTQEGGHRAGFERDGRWAAMMTAEELEAYLEPYGQYAEKCNELRIAHQYYESLGEKSILGWDLSRYLCLCRWGYLCGWLSEREAWELMIPVARRLGERFDSWEELGANYLIGRRYWSLKQSEEDGHLYEEAMDRLREMPSSPWNRYPWDLDLSGAYELIGAGLPPEPTGDEEPAPPAEERRSLPKIEMPVIDVIEVSEPNLSVIHRLDDLEKEGPVRVVPDGYATIQAAVDAAEPGETVFIREGEYDEWISVEDKRDVCIMGEGAGKVALHMTDPNKNEIISIQRCENITVSDMTLEKVRQEGLLESNSVIRVLEGDGHIERCRIVNHQGYGINYLSGGKGVIRETVFESCALSGTLLLEEATDITITGCCFRGNKKNGILAYRGLTLHVQDSLFEKNGVGLFIIEEGSCATISDCVFRENSDRGILVGDGACATVENTICELHGNSGIHIYGEGATVSLVDSRLPRNRIGMTVEKFAKAAIERCIVEENQSTGIWVNLDADMRMQNSVCRGNSNYGIFFEKGARGVLEESLFEGNQSDGVIVHGRESHLLSRGNHCRENEGSGIMVYDQAWGEIYDTVCYDNHKGGIRVTNGALATVDNNICAGNGQSGIEVYHNRATASLKNNHCFYNKMDGITFAGSGRGSIVDCVCEMNQRNGITVFEGGTTAELKSNRCIQNGQYGIVFDTGAISTADHCVCENNTYSGIAVRHEKTRVELNGNECRFNQFNGIMLSNNAGPSVKLTENLCLNNYPSGIFLLEGAGGEFHRNRCEGNPWAGIAIQGDGTMPVIADNELSGNGTWGIRVWDGAAPVLRDNAMDRNGVGGIFIEPEEIVSVTGAIRPGYSRP